MVSLFPLRPQKTSEAFPATRRGGHPFRTLLHHTRHPPSLASFVKSDCAPASRPASQAAPTQLAPVIVRRPTMPHCRILTAARSGAIRPSGPRFESLPERGLTAARPAASYGAATCVQRDKTNSANERPPSACAERSTRRDFRGRGAGRAVPVPRAAFYFKQKFNTEFKKTTKNQIPGRLIETKSVINLRCIFQ